MASTASHVSFLPPILTFCGAAVVAVPVFRLLGLSAVLGYLAAGVAIGPSGLSLVEDPQTIATVAELGVVLLLFIIGLELKLSHLWEMKRDIFGLGFAQLTVTALLLGGARLAIGFSPQASFVTGAAVALSATAIALQMLGERNDLQTPYGQRSFAILLFQDLSVVPLLAILPLLASGAAAEQDPYGPPSRGRRGAARDRRRRADRPLRAQPVLPDPRPQRRPRGDDRLRAACGSRRGPPHAGSRPLHGHGRLPGRAPARRVEFPASAGGRYRALPRHAARPVLHERGHVDRSCPRARAMGAAGRCGARRLLRQDLLIAVLSRLFGASWRDGLRSARFCARRANSPSC